MSCILLEHKIYVISPMRDSIFMFVLYYIMLMEMSPFLILYVFVCLCVFSGIKDKMFKYWYGSVFVLTLP